MRIYFMLCQYWVRIGSGPDPLEGPYNSLAEAEAAHKKELNP